MRAAGSARPGVRSASDQRRPARQCPVPAGGRVDRAERHHHRGAERDPQGWPSRYRARCPAGGTRRTRSSGHPHGVGSTTPAGSVSSRPLTGLGGTRPSGRRGGQRTRGRRLRTSSRKWPISTPEPKPTGSGAPARRRRPPEPKPGDGPVRPRRGQPSRPASPPPTLHPHLQPGFDRSCSEQERSLSLSRSSSPPWWRGTEERRWQTNLAPQSPRSIPPRRRALRRTPWSG